MTNSTCASMPKMFILKEEVPVQIISGFLRMQFSWRYNFEIGSYVTFWKNSDRYVIYSIHYMICTSFKNFLTEE